MYELPASLPTDNPLSSLALIGSLSFLVPLLASAEEQTVPVTVADFVRAESDHMIRANMKMVGAGIGELAHLREPTTPDNQPVIRMNQDHYMFVESKPGTYEHLVGAAAGWGALPRTAAYYEMGSVDNNDGYLEKNDLGRNSFNNSSATPNEDGSYTIRFGGGSREGNPRRRMELPEHRAGEVARQTKIGQTETQEP